MVVSFSNGFLTNKCYPLSQFFVIGRVVLWLWVWYGLIQKDLEGFILLDSH